MKHKVGDRVKVKNLEWYYSLPEDYELIYGIIERGRYDHFVEDMSEYCGRIVEISDIVEVNKHEYYRIKEDYEEFYWSDYMFEEEMKENNEKVNGRTITFDYTSNGKNIEIILNNEWTAKVGDNGNVILKQKPKYPETFEECCKILGEQPDAYESNSTIYGYESDKIASFQKLLICRNAYWKVIGEQFGLNGPWKPEYVNGVNNTYCTIHTFNSKVRCLATSHRQSLLAFPDEEIRDKFHVRFECLIDDCEEFL